MLIYSIYISYI
jgi:hypothetical protein